MCVSALTKETIAIDPNLKAAEAELLRFTESGGRLILYFDINKTLIAEDSASLKTEETLLNNILSQYYKACWDENISEAITFYEYVKNHLYPGSKQDIETKNTWTKLSGEFIQWLQKERHPLYQTVKDHYQRLSNHIGKEKIFSSFFRMIDLIEKCQCRANIVLRSFGDDIQKTIRRIESHNSKWKFTFIAKAEKGQFATSENKTLSPIQLFRTLNEHSFSAIQDDYNYWHKSPHCEQFQYGKAFLFDETSPKKHCIFFDDHINIKPSYPKNIVAPISTKNGTLNEDTLDALIKKNQLIQVDTIQAIENPNYYTDKIIDSLRVFLNSIEYSL